MLLPRLAALPLGLLSCVLAALAPAQTTHTWTGTNSGEWGDYANWSTSLVPDTAGDSVGINNTASGAPLTTMIALSGSPFTVRGIAANNASPYGAIILGSPSSPGVQSLNLSDSSGAVPAIDVSAGQLQIAASLAAGQGFSKTGSGALLITGPTSGGTITLNGGELAIAGANSVNSLVHKIIPSTATIAPGAVVGSTLRLQGGGALPYPSAGLSFDFAGQALVNNTVTATVDLGGLHRDFKTISFLNVPRNVSTSGDSTIAIDFQNGELEAKSLSNFNLSSGDPGMNLEVRLPASATITGSLSIGSGSNYSNIKIGSGRVRIGTAATFRTSQIYMGFNGSSGRIDARAPGSTLTISGNNATTRLGSLDMGNLYHTLPGYDTAIDLENGTLNLLANRISIRGASCATAPAQASIRFGGGQVDVTDLTIGGSPQYAYDYRCLVVQKGGSAKISSLTFAQAYSATMSDTRTLRYQLHGGALELGNASTAGNFTVTGAFSRGFDWLGGTIRNYAGKSASISATGNGTIASPMELSISGAGTRTLDVEAGVSFTLGNGTLLKSDNAAVALQKIGGGALVLAGDSTAYTGALRLDAGTIALGLSTDKSSAHVGALLWNTGALACDLSPADLASDRWIIDRKLSKGPAPASASGRVIDLKSGSGHGTYTLATYASTELTLDDFTVTGLPSGIAAEFTVGPTALTVAIAPDSPFAAWRRAKLSSTSNLGSAADLADPDGDGRSNLLEYALGSEPLSTDTAAPLSLAEQPADGESPARLALTFHRIADPALTYAIVAADDLSGPWSGDDAEVIFSSTGEQNTAGPVTVTDPAPVYAHPRRFLRLVVTR